MIELWQIQNWYHFLLGIIVGGGIISIYRDYKIGKIPFRTTKATRCDGKIE